MIDLKEQPVLLNPAALLFIVAMTLLSVGLVMVYSASGARAGLENRRVAAAVEQTPEESRVFHHGSDYLIKQLVWGALGMIALFAAARVPMTWLEKAATPILIVSLLLLVAVLATPFGVEAKGAKRWLRLGPITIQPSEFAKIGLVIFMACFLSERRERLRDFWQGFVPALAIFGIFAVLVILEKDLGTTVLMGVVMVSMWCLARMRISHLSLLVVAALPAVAFMILQHGYRINRIIAILDPEKYALTHAYQLNQSLIAVGSGGIFGQGVGYGIQKYHFLSEAHTDFIFASVGEEMGFLGAASVVLLFVCFIVLGLRISYKAPDYFGGLLAAGLTMVIGWAAFINFFVVLGMAPTKGLALPFLTYGGSSLIATLVSVGLLINISNYSIESIPENQE